MNNLPQNNHLSIVIMAAGKGTRMNTHLPKVLHELGGTSMIDRVLKTARHLHPGRIVVVTGYGADAVEDSIMDPKPIFARQMPQLGTGHAVQQALPHLSRHGMTIILNGDTPLIKHQTIEKMISTCAGCGMLLLTARLDDPTGYGRIMRNSRGAIIGIVEDKDATEEQKQVNEVYTGMMAVSTFHLRRWLGKLSNDNAQQEYYLTDIVGMAVVNGTPVHSVLADSSEEVLGVNTPEQLKILEEYLK